MMKYWILTFFITWSFLAVAQSHDVSQTIFNPSSDEPLALLDRPQEIGLKVEQPIVRHQRSLGCDAEVFLTEDPIPPGAYEASQTIIATGVVQSGTVSMRAAEEVILDADVSGEFEVQAGAVLEITMGPCTF